MLTMADTGMESAEGTLASYRGMKNFLGWEVVCTVVGLNCWTLDMLKETKYPKQAYELGKAMNEINEEEWFSEKVDFDAVYDGIFAHISCSGG